MDNVRILKAGIFQAMAHPTRLAVLEMLEDKELTVGGLAEALEVPQANLSQHLAVLRTHRLVSARKEGNQVFYSIRDPLLHRVLETMRRYSRAHLAEDEAVLRDLKARMRRG